MQTLLVEVLQYSDVTVHHLQSNTHKYDRGYYER